MFFGAALDEDVEAPPERRRPVVRQRHVHVQLHVSARHHRHDAVQEEALWCRMLVMLTYCTVSENSTASGGGRRGIARAAPAGMPKRSAAGCGPAENRRAAAARHAGVVPTTPSGF